jgi:hypothetical protein
VQIGTILKKFMVAVVEAIESGLAAKLQPEENKIVSSWREKGMVPSLYFRADGLGLFAVMHAGSEAEIWANMETLPFYPYMQITVTEIK